MKDRYSRQVLFSPIGTEGQEKIRSKHVLLIGAGALGSANAEMLVRAGVGKLTMVDRDYVEWSNSSGNNFIARKMPFSACQKQLQPKSG